MDVEVNASGFSKEIQEFDKVLEEMERDKDEDGEYDDDDEDECAGAAAAEPEDCDEKETDEPLDDVNNNLTVQKEKNIHQKELAIDHSEHKECEKQDLAQCASTNDDAVDQELYDKFDENLHISNKQFRPYRDQANESDDEQNDSDDDCSVTTTTSTIMDPHQVRAKVKKGLLKKIKTERRRIRNKGESALVTEKNREITDNIKASMHFFK